MPTIVLLVISNIFMTFAWYGHLKHHSDVPLSRLWVVVLISWGIAFFEYCFMIPANHLGVKGGWTPGQLKITQEAITLIVFAFFSWLYLGQKLTWNYYVAFALVFAAVAMVFFVPAGRVDG